MTDGQERRVRYRCLMAAAREAQRHGAQAIADEYMSAASAVIRGACCTGSDPACPVHGVDASNRRENEFYRRHERRRAAPR